MKKGLLGVVLVFLVGASYSQEKIGEKAGGRVTGTVMDSALNSPLEYATITLFASGKNIPVNGTTADSAGRFILTRIPSGSFRIVIESIGYQPLHINNVTINQKHQVIDLRNVYLKRKHQTLQDVTVTAQ